MAQSTGGLPFRLDQILGSRPLRGYEGPIRQIAVSGLGHDNPTLFISNHFDETPRELIIRYAGRNRIEDGLGISVNFFHLDCLASEVRLNVDLDATFEAVEGRSVVPTIMKGTALSAIKPERLLAAAAGKKPEF